MSVLKVPGHTMHLQSPQEVPGSVEVDPSPDLADVPVPDSATLTSVMSLPTFLLCQGKYGYFGVGQLNEKCEKVYELFPL